MFISLSWWLPRWNTYISSQATTLLASVMISASERLSTAPQLTVQAQSSVRRWPRRAPWSLACFQDPSARKALSEE